MSAVLSRPLPLGLRRKGAFRMPEEEAASAPSESQCLVDGPPSSAGFSALLAEFRSVGGAARGDDLARLLEQHHRGNFVSLARLIAAREIFGFEWRQTLWIPMFQFKPLDLSVESGAQRVLAELSDVFDGWELATWFVRRNDRLSGQRPVDALSRDLPAVLAAARTDRFVAAG